MILTVVPNERKTVIFYEKYLKLTEKNTFNNYKVIYLTTCLLLYWQHGNW